METQKYFEDLPYPEKVINYSREIFDCFAAGNFFSEEDIDPFIFSKFLCEKVMPNWLSGDDVELTEEDLMEVILYSSTKSVLIGMKNKGLLDSIEDESGEECFFLTPDGKEAAEELSSRKEIE